MNTPAYLPRQYQFHSALTAFFRRRETQKGVLDVAHPSGTEVFFPFRPIQNFLSDKVKTTLATKSPNLVVAWRESGDLVARQANEVRQLVTGDEASKQVVRREYRFKERRGGQRPAQKLRFHEIPKDISLTSTVST